MTISFKDLCNELNLPSSYEQESNLDTIKTWCREHISQDAHFKGSAAVIYSKYLAFVENYLANFSAHLPEDLAKPVPAYGNLNAIHYAAQQGYDRFIAALPRTSESAINDAAQYGMTPLHKAATKGHVHTVKALLSKGANPHNLNEQKQLAIQNALFVPILHDEHLMKNKEKIARELLPLTPEIFSLSDADGNTILHLLAINCFKQLLDQIVASNPELAFIKNRAFVYPVHTAILNRQTDALNTLLSIKGVSELADGHACLPLHYAARYGTAAMVQSCCEATPNINCLDSEGRTPLLSAAYADNLDALKMLIKQGADPKCADYQGFTILHIAVNQKNEAMVHWIVDHLSALQEQVDANDKKPVYYAKKNDSRGIEALLSGKDANHFPTPR
ncbi:ankyrin repeat domain-containing protein [Legionella shakespearei]|uniref:Ankyrin repeat protein n=1 Tax=Legionella shakespearei DSM 23087 TaxID=1122169 RepID=A0A0W0Z4R0_9GAMM|nr:ankyrin repeat domain-containing protein [Legionella shakespearei]KTD64140.1 Ankyrin repeat protein [Legionella shakespearei DSM 23087]